MAIQKLLQCLHKYHERISKVVQHEGLTTVTATLSVQTSVLNTSGVWCRLMPPHGSTTFGVKNYRIKGVVYIEGNISVKKVTIVSCKIPKLLRKVPPISVCL